MKPLATGRAEATPWGSHLWVHDRAQATPPFHLGVREAALFSELEYEHRRSEWLAGRFAAKSVIAATRHWAFEDFEVLPEESGAPSVWFRGERATGCYLNITHTHGYAAAAVSPFAIGIDICDDDDGTRLPRIARRVMSEGEAEECGAHDSPRTQATVWAIKEAVLKLRIGGVFNPGARSVRVISLDPPRVADPAVEVWVYPLATAALAIARGV